MNRYVIDFDDIELEESSGREKVKKVKMKWHVVEKGEAEGHPFRGNQWTAGRGGKSMQERYNIAETFANMPATIPEDGGVNTVKVRSYNEGAERLQAMYPMLNKDIAQRFFYMEGCKTNVEISGSSYEGDPIVAEVRYEGRYSGTQRVEFSTGSDKSVHMDYLRLYPTGEGAGMPLVIKQVAMMKMLGVEKVEMFADIYIGRYSWAKEGVDYKYDYDRRDALPKYEAWRKEMAERGIKIKDYGGFKKFTKPWQWARYQVPGVKINKSQISNPDAWDKDYNVGAAFMLDELGHGNWEAVLDLTKIKL